MKTSAPQLFGDSTCGINGKVFLRERANNFFRRGGRIAAKFFRNTERSFNFFALANRNNFFQLITICECDNQLVISRPFVETNTDKRGGLALVQKYSDRFPIKQNFPNRSLACNIFNSNPHRLALNNLVRKNRDRRRAGKALIWEKS